MTDASIASAAVSDELPAGATPQPSASAPAWQPAGMPVTPADFNSPEAVAARAEIDAKKGDRDFYKALVSERERGVTGPASQAWAALHKKGWPSPTAIATPADVKAQQDARTAEMWSGYIAALKQRTALSAEQEAEIRSGVVHEAAYAWAKEEKDRLIKDGGFRTKLLSGDRAANRDWTLVTSILSLRPVKK